MNEFRAMFTLLSARTPIRAVARRSWTSRQSVTRCLQNEVFAQLRLKGRVLELGGGRNALYNMRLRTDTPIETLNVAPEQEPTYLVDPDDPIPIEDGANDAILCVDTLEHVYDFDTIVSEIVRVLKPGGTLHMMDPLFCPRHGTCGDFCRFTGEFWVRHLRDIGCSSRTVEPIVFGPFSACSGHLEKFLGMRRMRALALWLDLRVSRSEKDERLADPLNSRVATFASDYYICGTKSEAVGARRRDRLRAM